MIRVSKRGTGSFLEMKQIKLLAFKAPERHDRKHASEIHKGFQTSELPPHPERSRSAFGGGHQYELAPKTLEQYRRNIFNANMDMGYE